MAATTTLCRSNRAPRSISMVVGMPPATEVMAETYAPLADAETES